MVFKIFYGVVLVYFFNLVYCVFICFFLGLLLVYEDFVYEWEKGIFLNGYGFLGFGFGW